ncbi:MAG: transposase [Actinomycetota bacterium]|jgi:transposase|nr:transposase [Actinomycetota bacterium]
MAFQGEEPPRNPGWFRDLDETDVAHLLDRFCSKTQRSGLKPFVTLAKTIRKHREGILSAIRLGVNNTRRSPS